MNIISQNFACSLFTIPSYKYKTSIKIKWI